MDNLITGFFVGLIGILCFFVGVYSQPGYDYTIELNELHGVIINNDTIELHKLEEYIYVDNI